MAKIITKQFPETNIFVIFLWSFSSFSSCMQSDFAINAKLIASKNDFCKEVFVKLLAAMVYIYKYQY